MMISKDSFINASTLKRLKLHPGINYKGTHRGTFITVRENQHRKDCIGQYAFLL